MNRNVFYLTYMQS